MKSFTCWSLFLFSINRTVNPWQNKLDSILFYSILFCINTLKPIKHNTLLFFKRSCKNIMRNMSNMSKLLCSHHPTETPISNHIGCRLYGQQGMYSIHAMRGGWLFHLFVLEVLFFNFYYYITCPHLNKNTFKVSRCQLTRQ